MDTNDEGNGNKGSGVQNTFNRYYNEWLAWNNPHMRYE